MSHVGSGIARRLLIVVGVLAVADGVITDKALKWILLASGLLTAWRGYFNSRQPEPQP